MATGLAAPERLASMHIHYQGFPTFPLPKHPILHPPRLVFFHLYPVADVEHAALAVIVAGQQGK